MSRSRVTRHIIHDLVSLPTEQLKHELALAQKDKANIRERMNDLARDLTHIEMEEQLLAQVLRMRQAAEDGVPGAGATLAALESRAPVAREESLSANVLSIVRQAERPLLPSDTRARLADKGVSADLNAVRVALRRWVDRGQLFKDGRYYYASSDHLRSLA